MVATQTGRNPSAKAPGVFSGRGVTTSDLFGYVQPNSPDTPAPEKSRRSSRIRHSGEALRVYAMRGWDVTAVGNVGINTPTGPCADCGKPHERYGENGGPLCRACT